jgi:hypothetical protein
MSRVAAVEGANMTFTDNLIVVWVVLGIFLIVIPIYLPSARGSIISPYEAGMFAVYLIVIAWGVLRVVGGAETAGWSAIILAAGLFGWRLYWLFLQYERKVHPNHFAAVNKGDWPKLELSPEEEQEREHEQFMRRMGRRMNWITGAAAILFFLIWLVYRKQ